MLKLESRDGKRLPVKLLRHVTFDPGFSDAEIDNTLRTDMLPVTKLDNVAAAAGQVSATAKTSRQATQKRMLRSDFEPLGQPVYDFAEK